MERGVRTWRFIATACMGMALGKEGASQEPGGTALPRPLPPALERRVDFQSEVYPLLRSRCFKCHAGSTLPSGVRLDFRPELLGETNGRPLLLPGKSAESPLILAVAGRLGPEKAMPPSGKPLSTSEIGLLRSWIDEGAPWDESLLPSTVTSAHWAFQLVRRPPVPGRSGQHPIDAFIAKEQEARGLLPGTEASPRTLLRRAFLDLTGLPPSPGETAAFLEDSRPDAYEKLVERLLSSPRYGERWGRHWLDVARYSESEGYESNHPRPHAWRYRDYVIDSFNRDKPFDRFLREQIAGDEMEPFSDEHLIATGFLGAARLSSNEEDHALQRNDVLVDIANATASAFLGLTLHCAQCHSHKFDPITQRDYYRFQAFFLKGQPNNLALKSPDLSAAFRASKPAEYDSLVHLVHALFEKGRARFRERAISKMSPEMRSALDVAEEDRTSQQQELCRQADLAFQATPDGYEAAIPEEDRKLYAEAKKSLEALRKRVGDVPQVWGFYSPATSPTSIEVLPSKAFYPLPYDPDVLRRAVAFLRIRGEVHRRGGRVSPGWPEVFGPTPPGKVDAHPRLALADWLTCRENPLVARVWVNRVWHYHFGRGLVATPGDFGTRGAPPSHPALLDWLAAELMDSGWSTKHLHRLILNSAAYRQSSRTVPENVALDPENRYLWRWAPRRLEAEAIRDSLLAVAGELDLTQGGPFIPPEEAQRSLRRSVYLMQKRDSFPRFQALFDGPTANESCACRQTSTVALQPLLLLNSPFAVERARGLASRVRVQARTDPRAQGEAAFELSLGRPPTSEEGTVAAAFLARPEGDRGDSTLSTLVRFCQVLLNLNEFIYLE